MLTTVSNVWNCTCIYIQLNTTRLEYLQKSGKFFEKENGDDMSNILEVRNLCKKYESGKGIKDINFQLKKGMILGIIGLNGAGKATLLSCLTGSLSPDSGDVEYLFDGVSYKNPDLKILNNLGI